MIFEKNEFGEIIRRIDLDYIVDQIKVMPIDDRLTIFSQFCTYCGDYTGSEYCTCMRDD